MKKTTIWVLFMLAGFILMAQDEATDRFRPSKNNFSAEVNFKPFSSEAPISIDGFRGRLFLSNKLAIRIGCNFATKKIHDETPFVYNNTVYYNTRDERYTVAGVNTGIEYHFLNSKRFSPYVGVIIGFENKSSKAVYDDVEPDYYSGTNIYKTVTTEYKNAWRYYSGTQTNLIERGYTRISGNIVLGGDIYLMKHLYMGLELGLGYNSLVYKEVEITGEGTLATKFPKAKDNGFSINVNNSIRLGFWF